MDNAMLFKFGKWVKYGRVYLRGRKFTWKGRGLGYVALLKIWNSLQYFWFGKLIYKSRIFCALRQISGAISFRDIEFRMLKLYGGKLDALKTELLIVCKGDERCVNERLNQIEQYRKLGAYSRGAETMINIQQMFELSGDFTPVETLVDLVSLFKIRFT